MAIIVALYLQLLLVGCINVRAMPYLPIPSRSQNSSSARTKCLLKGFAVDEDDEVGGAPLFFDEELFVSLVPASPTHTCIHACISFDIISTISAVVQ